MSYWILDFLPIPLGICGFLVIKSLRINIDRIRITRGEDAGAGFLERTDIDFHKHDVFNPRESDKKLLDLAITSGNFVGDGQIGRIGIISEKGSFVRQFETRALARSVLEGKTGKITILAPDRKGMDRFVLRHSAVSGTVVWFALVGEMKMVGV